MKKSTTWIAQIKKENIAVKKRTTFFSSIRKKTSKKKIKDKIIKSQTLEQQKKRKGKKRRILNGKIEVYEKKDIKGYIKKKRRKGRRGNKEKYLK